MTRARGHALQRATAAYLAHWWTSAESAANGRTGRDILGTPGVWFEVKTSLAGTSPSEIVKQAVTGAINAGAASDLMPELPVVLYWPPGVGAARPELAIAMLPLPKLMRLLTEAGYAPEPKEDS